MNQVFKVNVNNNFDFDIDSENASQMDIIKTNTSYEHLLHHNRSYRIEVIEEDFQNKHYKVKINNHTYNININNQLDELIKALGFEIGSAKKADKISAPMPGLILDVSIKTGDVVKENDPLLILEAMKMENIISSPRDGTIKSIVVKKGDTVDKNQLLIEFE